MTKQKDVNDRKTVKNPSPFSLDHSYEEIDMDSLS